MKLYDSLVRACEGHLEKLAEGKSTSVPDAKRWMNEDLLPFLRGLEMAGGLPEVGWSEETARRERLVMSLVMEADPSLPPMTFDASCDHLRSMIADWPRRIAFERSQVKRETLRQAAKDMEPTEAEILELRAEVDELRGKVAARDEALRLIQAALGEVGKSL